MYSLKIFTHKYSLSNKSSHYNHIRLSSISFSFFVVFIFIPLLFLLLLHSLALYLSLSLSFELAFFFSPLSIFFLLPSSRPLSLILSGPSLQEPLTAIADDFCRRFQSICSYKIDRYVK